MPYNPELGMRVYDPREGAMLGQQMAEAIMQNQYRKGVLALQQEAALRDKARDQIAMEEAKRKAKSMILRDIGLVQMQKEADVLTQQGMDPLDARKRALWNNSHLIFAESPAEIPNLMQDEARADYNQRSLAERIRHAQEIEKQAAENRSLKSDVEATKIDLAREKLAAQASRGSESKREADEIAELRRQLRTETAEMAKIAEVTPDFEERKERIQGLQDRLNAMEARRGYEEISVGPEGTKIIKGQKAGAATPEKLTTQNLSRAQESLTQSMMTIDAAKRLLPLINSETVGPRAFVESWVNDRVLANFFPQLANQKRVSAERVAAELRATTIRLLRSDGQISEPERKQILEAIPQINNPIDSPKRAQELIITSMKGSALFAIVTARTMGVPPPSTALMALEDTDIIASTKTGLFSKEEAQKLWQLKRSL